MASLSRHVSSSIVVLLIHYISPCALVLFLRDEKLLRSLLSLYYYCIMFSYELVLMFLLRNANVAMLRMRSAVHECAVATFSSVRPSVRHTHVFIEMAQIVKQYRSPRNPVE